MGLRAPISELVVHAAPRGRLIAGPRLELAFRKPIMQFVPCRFWSLGVPGVLNANRPRNRTFSVMAVLPPQREGGSDGHSLMPDLLLVLIAGSCGGGTPGFTICAKPDQTLQVNGYSH